MPIGIHEGSSVIVPTLGSDRPFNPLVLHAVSHPSRRCWPAPSSSPSGCSSAIRACAASSSSPAAAGPRSGSSASTSRPSPSAASAPTCALRPSEYFARQCAISFEVDERTLPALAPFVGPGRIVWGSDYPHHDATFPGAVDALRATIAPCPTATQAKILGLNARGIYRLPPRHVGPAALIGDYFAAVTAQDPDLLRALFAPDAVLDVDGDRRTGHEDILRYYTEHTFVFEDFRPEPGPAARRRVPRDGRHRRPPRRGRAHGARRLRDRRHAHHRAARPGVRRRAAGRGPALTHGSGSGWGRGPRRSRPGRAPVASSCSRTTTPDLTVAT